MTYSPDKEFDLDLLKTEYHLSEGELFALSTLAVLPVVVNFTYERAAAYFRAASSFTFGSTISGFVNDGLMMSSNEYYYFMRKDFRDSLLDSFTDEHFFKLITEVVNHYQQMVTGGGSHTEKEHALYGYIRALHYTIGQNREPAVSNFTNKSLVNRLEAQIRNHPAKELNEGLREFLNEDDIRILQDILPKPIS